mmetsp:Transcript_90822/g.236604  ORF Transcript_90822/g.236604 Transcript_90822/m.236604 type:complete len:272 (+) Transcript_90822:529-1344(+)
MSREFLMATCRKSGLVGAVPLRFWPAAIWRTTSALVPGAMSGTWRLAALSMPKVFLFTWMAKPFSGPGDELEKVIFSRSWPCSLTSADMTPKPLLPPCPGCDGFSTGVFCVAGAAAAAGASSPPSRSRRSPPPPPPPEGPPPPLSSRGPRSSSSCTSRRRAWRSSSSYSSSSGASSCACALVVTRVTNSSADLWYTLLMRARSWMSLSRRPFSIVCESSLIGGLSPSTTCLVASGFVDSRRQYMYPRSRMSWLLDSSVAHFSTLETMSCVD